MDYDLEKRIEELRQKKEGIVAINSKEVEDRTIFEEEMIIKDKKYREEMGAEMDALERLISTLKLERERLSKEFNTLCGETVPVRLGDLIEELARLRCIDDTYIRVNIKPITSFDGLHYIDEITKLINTVYYDFTATLEITLACSWCTKDCAGITSISRIFSYLIRTNSKFTDVQADGKTLLEHCDANVIYNTRTGKHSTDLVVSENIKDLVVNISLGHMIRESDAEWYPIDLIKQALINCEEKSKEKEATKKRSKKLTNK